MSFTVLFKFFFALRLKNKLQGNVWSNLKKQKFPKYLNYFDMSQFWKRAHLLQI